MTNHLKIWMFLGAFASTTLAFTSPAPAATVTPGPPSSGGINYTWTVANLGGTDTSGAIQRHVGALSFNDPINFGRCDRHGLDAHVGLDCGWISPSPPN